MASTFSIHASRAVRSLFMTQWPLDKNTVSLDSAQSCTAIAMIVFIQGFEVEMYLRAIECDVLNKTSVGPLLLSSNVLWPEVFFTTLTTLIFSFHFFPRAGNCYTDQYTI